MGRFFSRVIGYWLVAIALVAAVVDGSRSIAAAAWSAVPIGQYWYDLSPATLDGAQTAVQRSVGPWLWDPIVMTVIQQPVWAVAAPLGLLLIWLGRKRRRVPLL